MKIVISSEVVREGDEEKYTQLVRCGNCGYGQFLIYRFEGRNYMQCGNCAEIDQDPEPYRGFKH